MLEGAIQFTGRSTERVEVTGTSRGPRGRHRRCALLARLSAMSLTGSGRRLETDRQGATEATAVARAWLQLVDSGRSTLSWHAAAAALRVTIEPRDWDAALRSARFPLGRCRARKLLGRETVEAFPGVPTGPYTVVHFESVFAEKPQGVETVTVRREDDGHWRVVAYFIR